MTNNTPTVTRRETLAGIGLAAATATVPVSASASVGGDSVAWDKAMAAFKKAENEAQQIVRLYGVAESRFIALRPSLDMIDKKNLPCVMPSEHQLAVSLDLDQAWERFLASEGKTWWAANPDKKKAEVRAALDSVQAYRDQLDHARSFTKLRYYEEQADAATERLGDARDALLEMPAPHAKALLFKLEYFMEDTVYTEDFVAPTIADMRRLLGA